MKGITTISLLVCLFTNAVFSQMYVGPNSYVFNKGTSIFVTSDINLSTATTSNIYLRDGGQLLQGGTTVGGSNSGLGELSVYQEGTANNYGYNYWCSPVGVAADAAGNNNFQLNPVIRRPSTSTVSSLPSYTTGYNGSAAAGALTISTYWIYQYQASVGYGYGADGWEYKGQTGAIIPGLGFTMKGVSGDDTTDVGEATLNNPAGANSVPTDVLDNQRYDFRGKPNDGTINIAVEAPIAGVPNSTLTGNPYPSAINLNYFLLENSGYIVNSDGTYYNPLAPAAATGSIDGIAYFWEHEKPATTHNITGYVGGYGQYVPNGTSVNSPGTYNNATWNTYDISGNPTAPFPPAPIGAERYKRMFSPVGQGFFVNGVTNGNAQMKNKYRAHVKEGLATNSQFERTSTEFSSTTESEYWDDIPNVAGFDYTQFSKAPVPQIKIHTVLNNELTKEVTLAFNPNTTEGFDRAMDAFTIGGSNTTDAYFSIAGNPNQFVITTMPFDIYKRVPFTLNAVSTSTYKVYVGNTINFNGSDTVYLYDGLTGVYHDIKNGFFEIALPEGIYTNRFEITFQDSALAIDDTIKNNFVVIQNNQSQLLSVNNPNSLDLKSAHLFDISGKLIFKKADLGVKSTYEFSTAGLSDGVYLVKIQSVDGLSYTQKVIIEKAK